MENMHLNADHKLLNQFEFYLIIETALFGRMVTKWCCPHFTEKVRMTKRRTMLQSKGVVQ